MNNWRFAFNRRWFGYLGVAIIFAIACVLLSQWQFARRDEAVAEVERITANYDSAPAPLAEVLPTLDGFDTADKWRPVTVTGEYLVDEQLLVRNRPYNGNPGYEVLTPLRLDDGTVFIIDRGWIAPASTDGPDDAPHDVPPPPSGQVTVVARVKAGEPSLAGRTAPAGQIPTIELAQVATLLDRPTFTGAYGLIDGGDPAALATPPKPELDEGPHLSYAVQWIVFALFGFGGLAYALRQEYRLINADDPAERERAAIRRAKTAAKRTDADIEDELLDAR